MSITAEKIGEALAYLESEYSIKECCGHPVGGNGPEDEPACCAQPDLYLRSDKVKETLLSLLQQGEPEGWRPIETAPKDGTKIITFAPDGGIEVSFYYADTLENGTAYETWRDDGCEPTHWMPLPPAPGAETGASSSRQAVLEEAHPVWRGDVRCAPELGGCWIDDQGKCQHCGFQYERKK